MKYSLEETTDINATREATTLYADCAADAKAKASRLQVFQGTVLVLLEHGTGRQFAKESGVWREL